MSSSILKSLLLVFAILSGLLLLGTFLRAKVKLFQDTFLPASVIGGIIGLILGPQVLGGHAILRFSEEVLKTASLLPGILIVPVIVSVPLGFMIKKGKEGTIKETKNIMVMTLILLGIAGLQASVGFSTNLLFVKIMPSINIYDTFGWELGMGFAGGHGAAGFLAGVLRDANLPYWEAGQGVAMTTATLGLLGGVIVGIIIINWAARKGHTSFLSKPSEIPKDMKIGIQKDISKQNSVGRETTLSSSIDAVAFHLSIIIAVTGGAYFLLDTVKKNNIPILKTLPVHIFGLLLMLIIWKIIKKCKCDYLIDGKIKGRVTGTLSEYAIVSGLISLPLKAVMTYIVPIIFMCLVGFILTLIYTFYFSKKYSENYWLERGLVMFGMSTGVMFTGVMLLRICDPDFKSPVFGDFGAAYSISTVVGFAMFPIFWGVLVKYGAAGRLGLEFGLTVFYTILLIFSVSIVNRISNKKLGKTGAN